MENPIVQSVESKSVLVKEHRLPEESKFTCKLKNPYKMRYGFGRKLSPFLCVIRKKDNAAKFIYSLEKRDGSRGKFCFFFHYFLTRKNMSLMRLKGA